MKPIVVINIFYNLSATCQSHSPEKPYGPATSGAKGAENDVFVPFRPADAIEFNEEGWYWTVQPPVEESPTE
jgi:hypothetical protein